MLFMYVEHRPMEASLTDADGVGVGVPLQVPDRMCVTAPSGDRSRSYIHPKTLHRTSEPGDTTEQVLLSNLVIKKQLSVTLSVIFS